MDGAQFSHPHPALAREHEGGHVSQTLGTKANGRFEEAVEFFRLEKIKRGGLIQRSQFEAERGQSLSERRAIDKVQR